MPEQRRLSAAELGRALGDDLPTAASVTAVELDLVDAIRDLIDAAVGAAGDDRGDHRGDDGSADLVEATQLVRAAIDAVCTRGVAAAHPVRIVRHPDGRFENLIQAGTGRLNPRGARLHFDDLSVPPPDSAAAPAPVEVTGHVILGASMSGPPGRAHGGIVASLLDEALGMAMMRAGRVGMTVSLEVSFRGAVPLGEELAVHARCTAFDGRKTHAEAELLAAGTVVATARGLFVASR